jgi:voltage-dependent potassium channel beta subunit
VDYRRLGNSGLKLSALSLGSWLTLGDAVDKPNAQKIIDTAIGSGVNFFDLADAYAHGGAEKQLGGQLKNHTRSQLVLSSKLFWPMSDDPNDCGLSRKHIFESVHRSLNNLETDYLDIYFCHREDTETPIEETVMAMDDLIRQGKILYWGTSMWSLHTLKKAVSFAKKHCLHAPVVEQPPYNLLERWIEKKTSSYKRLGIGLVSWSPLAGGLLTGKYADGIPSGSRGDKTDWIKDQLDEKNLVKVRAFSLLAVEMNIKPAQLALAWLLQNQAINSVITGASSEKQLESNLKAADVTIPNDINQKILKLFPA